MNRDSAVVVFQNLRKDAGRFTEDATPTQGFYRWREDVLVAFEEVFGRNSEEYRDFDAIRFESSPIRAALAERLGLELIPGATVSADSGHHFRERLFQAEEVLLGVIIGLRKSS